MVTKKPVIILGELIMAELSSKRKN